MTEYPETRDSLLVQVGDPQNAEAWEQFARIYRPVIFRLARRRGLQDADAHDLSQQVLMSVASSIEHWERNDESLPYLVMPYMRGASLQRRLDDEGPLPVSEVLRIGSQIAAGLAAAHSQGLVHRDIKPANILLEEGVERVAITDFGLARAVDDATMTRVGFIAGTPQYMSPEQARGDSVDQLHTAVGTQSARR